MTDRAFSTLLERAFCEGTPVTLQVDDGHHSSFQVTLLKFSREKAGTIVSFSVPEYGRQWDSLFYAAAIGSSILIGGSPATVSAAHLPQLGVREIELTVAGGSERAEEKDASRAADELALANGAAPADIERKNAFITADRTIVHWDKSKPL